MLKVPPTNFLDWKLFMPQLFIKTLVAEYFNMYYDTDSVTKNCRAWHGMPWPETHPTFPEGAMTCFGTINFIGTKITKKIRK